MVGGVSICYCSWTEVQWSGSDGLSLGAGFQEASRWCLHPPLSDFVLETAKGWYLPCWCWGLLATCPSCTNSQGSFSLSVFIANLAHWYLCVKRGLAGLPHTALFTKKKLTFLNDWIVHCINPIPRPIRIYEEGILKRISLETFPLSLQSLDCRGFGSQRKSSSVFEHLLCIITSFSISRYHVIAIKQD